MLVAHAETELRRAGLFDADSDYNGMVGEAVLKLVKVFAEEGHSGMSADITLSVFDRVARFKPLTPITSNPDEWMDIAEYNGNTSLWQNRRQSTCFSLDGGESYYDIDERRKWWRKFLGLGHRGFTIRQSGLDRIQAA